MAISGHLETVQLPSSSAMVIANVITEQMSSDEDEYCLKKSFLCVCF